MNNSKAETRLCQLSENGNSSSSPHLNLKSNSRQDISIERGRFSSKLSVKRRESLQVYSKRFPQHKKPKSFLMPRTKSLSKNSPIIRRCSLQEDQSILVFQVTILGQWSLISEATVWSSIKSCFQQQYRANGLKNSRQPSIDVSTYRRRKSLDIVEIREDVIEENGMNRFSNSLVSLDVDMMKRKMRTAFASIRKIPQSSLRNSSCASSVVSLASKGNVRFLLAELYWSGALSPWPILYVFKLWPTVMNKLKLQKRKPGRLLFL